MWACGRVLLALLLVVSPPSLCLAAMGSETNAAGSTTQQAARGGGPEGAAWAAAAAANSAAAFPTLWQYYESLYPSELLFPTLVTQRGHEVLYQLPHTPRATLFIAHGCAHAAHDWWPASEACPTCLGLPEEVAQTQQALALGYAVLAMSSTNETGCMDWGTNHKVAVDLIKAFRKKHRLEGLPLYGLGVSVGGGFVLKLPQFLQMDGLLSEVLGPRPQGWQPLAWEYAMPPTVFVSMDEDPFMAAKISRDSATLARMGVPTATVRVARRPVYPAFFSDRSSRIPLETSILAVAALHQIGMLDEQGYVTVDPRHTHKPWVKELTQLVPELSDGLTEDHSHVWEEMNLAYSSHEIISDFATAAFLWFESGGKANFSELVRQHSPPGSGVVGDASGALHPPPAATQAAPLEAQHASAQAPAAEAGGGMGADGEQGQPQQQEQQQPPQEQAGIRLGGDQHLPAQQAGRVLGAGPDVEQKLIQPTGAGRAQQAQQAQQGGATVDGTLAEDSLQPAALPLVPSVLGAAMAQASAAAPAAEGDGDRGVRSAATLVGAAAGTLVGAATLLVLYRLAERRRSGFAALPTRAPPQAWEPVLPVSSPLAPIPEGPDEVDP